MNFMLSSTLTLAQVSELQAVSGCLLEMKFMKLIILNLDSITSSDTITSTTLLEFLLW